MNGEGYSKDKYTKAQEDLANKEVRVATPPNSFEKNFYPDIQEMEGHRNFLNSQVLDAKQKLSDLNAKAHEEALVMNKKYERAQDSEYASLLDEAERLTEAARKAVEAVEEYEKKGKFGTAKED